jgi:hypothetical protein
MEIQCVKCEKVLENFMPETKGMQPNCGLAFLSYGHYGSTYFDPMNGTYIEISLCDECVKQADDRGLVYHGSNRPDPANGEKSCAPVEKKNSGDKP